MVDHINEEVKAAQKAIALKAQEKAVQHKREIKQAAKEKEKQQNNLEEKPDQELEKATLPEVQDEPEQEPEKATQSETITEQVKGSSLPKKTVKKYTNEGNLLENIKNYESKVGDKYLHIRVNSKTLNLLNQLSHVSKISNTKIVGYALEDFFLKNPELEQIIKNYLKNVEL
ncbi:MAG: hypothetical protein EOP43_07800 [Sphingobacteriaceae bacterium]|nr:MAG: hypothetical protein EOP43_07800 [Sphingobacteriaceae bacterium]